MMREMGNTLSKCSNILDCRHKLSRRDLQRKLKRINLERKLIERKLEECDASLTGIRDFRLKTPELPELITKTLLAGEDHLVDEKFFLRNELLDYSQEAAEVLTKILEQDRGCTVTNNM